MNIIQLVLFHLHQTDRMGIGFFRWKEDICRVIEECWDGLCPSKVQTASWMNSVSSVLSANAHVFRSGFEKLKQPGWWALKVVQPPRPAAPLAATPSAKKTRKGGEEAGRSDGEKQGLPLLLPPPLLHHPPLPARSPATVDTAQTLLLARHLAERIPNVCALLPPQTSEATPTTVRAAQEVKRKLVERLLRVDSRLLQEALTNSPASVPTSAVQGAGAAVGKEATSKFFPLLAHEADGSARDAELRARAISAKDRKRLQRSTKPANYVRASPHENELLESSLRVVNPDSRINRVKRKLLMRRSKRRLGLSVFDVDGFMYRYLKSGEALCFSEKGMQRVHSAGAGTAEASACFDIPFHRDPSLTFEAKLLGVSHVLPNYPTEVISPFSGLRLPGFIHRERRCRPLRARLLDELACRFTKAAGAAKNDERGDAVANNGGHEKASIDFVNVRKEWLPQVNRLLRMFFWASVDMVESLDYPEYGILMMYRRLVIGCVFMTPDGYVTYFFVHPEWRGAGLGALLLYLLLSRSVPRHMDVTLHASVTNPALLLYQKFGFKPEEYVVNFYDKYFSAEGDTVPDVRLYSKNAYYLRLRH